MAASLVGHAQARGVAPGPCGYPCLSVWAPTASSTSARRRSRMQDLRSAKIVSMERTPGALPQLDRIRELVLEVLGRPIVGVYLHGSAVLGGLRPRSDLDVLVVTTQPTTHDEKQRITDGLL